MAILFDLLGSLPEWPYLLICLWVCQNAPIYWFVCEFCFIVCLSLLFSDHGHSHGFGSSHSHGLGLGDSHGHSHKEDSHGHSHDSHGHSHDSHGHSHNSHGHSHGQSSEEKAAQEHGAKAAQKQIMQGKLSILYFGCYILCNFR